MIDEFLSEEDSLNEKHLDNIIKFVIDYIDVKKGEVTKFEDELTQRQTRRINYNQLTLQIITLLHSLVISSH